MSALLETHVRFALLLVLIKLPSVFQILSPVGLDKFEFLGCVLYTRSPSALAITLKFINSISGAQYPLMKMECSTIDWLQ